ncbi:MAG: methylated-DNA--[protein]-cysteine S-methyltransferase [Bryobacterales bacterium]|nr:methylated-DNA--[protein]-cysteine S-methyltransferase [Bryobacterales bacterium]
MQAHLLEGLIRYAGLRAPNGALVWVAADAEAIVRISPGRQEKQFRQEMARLAGRQPVLRPQDRLVREALAQLQEYFAGIRQAFELPVKLAGSPFQLRVWRALAQIPYGQTRSYREVALAAGSARGARAAGSACGANPVAIVVPCHRVVRSDGAPGGYGGGREFKRFLLDLEDSVKAGLPPRPNARSRRRRGP